MRNKPQARGRPLAAPPTGAGIGGIVLAGRSRASVGEELLKHIRLVVAPAELWLADRSARRLRRVPGPGLRSADVRLALGEPTDWPDRLRFPGPQSTGSLSALAAKVRGPAIGRLVRAPSGAANDVHGVLVAPYSGKRPPVSLDRALAVLAAQSGAALSNLAALGRSHERAEQLSVLYETAHQMSSALGLDHVLDTICVRARSLTGADLAYIMLMNTARGEGYVRATDGVRTPAFKETRLNVGDGLGGLVMKEARPYYSSDYLHDGRFVHVVDDKVAAEGIVSVVGVPLVVDDEVIGVLFAAYRRMTSFSEADVAFLESLAEHAAVALANAHLHQQTVDALDRERRLHRIAEQQRQELEDINRFHERLTELVLAEPEIEQLLRDITDALGHPVVLRDEVPDDGAAVPIAAGASVLGWLVVEDLPGSLGPRDVRGLEEAARVVGLHLLRDRAVVQAEYRVRGEFLDELLTADEEDRAELVLRGSYLGVDLARPLAVLFLLTETSDDVDTRDFVSRAFLDLAPGCLVAARYRGAVVLAPGQDPKAFAQRLSKRLAVRPDFRVTIGYCSGPTDLVGAAEALTDARRAARGARALGRVGDVVCREDLGVYGTLLLDEAGALRAFADRRLAAIVDYDATHGTDLCGTLEVYLDCGGNATEAARRLVLHVNSLYYRLNRIRDLGRYDLDDPETRFELQLASRVRKASGGP